MSHSVGLHLNDEEYVFVTRAAAKARVGRATLAREGIMLRAEDILGEKRPLPEGKRLNLTRLTQAQRDAIAKIVNGGA